MTGKDLPAVFVRVLRVKPDLVVRLEFNVQEVVEYTRVERRLCGATHGVLSVKDVGFVDLYVDVVKNVGLYVDLYEWGDIEVRSQGVP